MNCWYPIRVMYSGNGEQQRCPPCVKFENQCHEPRQWNERECWLIALDRSSIDHNERGSIAQCARATNAEVMSFV